MTLKRQSLLEENSVQFISVNKLIQFTILSVIYLQITLIRFLSSLH